MWVGLKEWLVETELGSRAAGGRWSMRSIFGSGLSLCCELCLFFSFFLFFLSAFVGVDGWMVFRGRERLCVIFMVWEIVFERGMRFGFGGMTE
jgi:hypothetical protein